MAGVSPALTSRLNTFNRPSVVLFRHLKFLIMDSPSTINIDQYITELVRHGCTDVVRACEPHYPGDAVKKAGMQMHEYEFNDGEPPPQEIIDSWLDLVEARFDKFTSAKSVKGYNPVHAGGTESKEGSEDSACIAVHCVAGLGRAPMLVAIALIEAGFDAVDAVTFIRKVRRGAINDKQFRFLEMYQPTRRSVGGVCCTIL